MILAALVDNQLVGANEPIKFVSLRVTAGSFGQSAEIVIDHDGKEVSASSEGNGPVDAVFKAIRQAVPHQGTKLDLFQVHTVSGGTDAQADVSVRLAQDGILSSGRAADVDTLVAAAKAYLHALNKLEVRRQKRIAA